MKSVLAIVAAALALSASSAFAQAQSTPAPAAKVSQAAPEVKLGEIDAKAYPKVKEGVLEAIDARVKLLQDDRKCVAASVDVKSLGECKKASESAQRAMVEKMHRSQGAPVVTGAPAPSAGARR
jgi:hypothetical protein